MMLFPSLPPARRPSSGARSWAVLPSIREAVLRAVLAASLACPASASAVDEHASVVDESGADVTASAAATALPPAPPLHVETVAAGLEHPWSLAFLPDGRQLVTERPGRLRIIEDGQPSPPVKGVPPVFAEGQGGLFDVVPHPDFADNGWLYLSFSHGTPDRNATRLARGRLDGAELVDVEVLFTAEPWKATPVHFGGRIAFLPDGTLLLTLGDGFDHREGAQRLDDHFGVIVRLHDDGRVPADNPYAGGQGKIAIADPAGAEGPDASAGSSLAAGSGAEARAETWSHGHRNPQGLAVDPRTGRVFAHEHGPAGGDEINRIEPGANYGWPIATHGRDYSGAAISPYTDYPGTVPPLLDWTPSIAPSGLAIVSGPSFPALEGELLVGSLKARELRRVRLDEAGAFIGEATLSSGHGRLRDVRVAPDGSVWLLTDADEGRVLRLTPEPEG